MSRQRAYHCRTCQALRGDPAYCAPLRCLCGHRDCPAYHSYINVREVKL